jgi:hypothetical protein
MRSGSSWRSTITNAEMNNGGEDGKKKMTMMMNRGYRGLNIRGEARSCLAWATVQLLPHTSLRSTTAPGPPSQPSTVPCSVNTCVKPAWYLYRCSCWTDTGPPCTVISAQHAHVGSYIREVLACIAGHCGVLIPALFLSQCVLLQTCGQHMAALIGSIQPCLDTKTTIQV